MKNMSARARNSLKCVAIILSVILCGGGCFLALFLRSRAIYTTDTTSYVKVNEIYDDSAGAMNPDNVNTLLRYITGDAEITYKTATDTLNAMATANTTSADIATKAVLDKANGDDVIVTFGGLDWQVVYLSKSTPESGEDIILTLWLANSTNTSKWSNGWHEDNSSYENPSNMYGSSYIRCVTLNAGGTYSVSSSGTASAVQSTTNKFARFTMEEVENSLTQYLATPSQMEWQLYQSAIKEIGFDYLCPNDSIEDPRPTLGGGYKYYNSTQYYDYHDKALYTAWGNDYIWLPSLAETGYSTSVNGLWETSTEQRQNVSSSGNFSWLRSGTYYSAYDAYYLYPAGDGYHFYVNVSNAVRPALHLNLTEVLANTFKGVTYVTLNNNGGYGLNEIYIDEDGGVFLDSELGNGVSVLPIVPVKTGFEFLGYFVENNTTSACVIDSEGNFTSNFVPENFLSETTFYAQWGEESTFKITLERNFGSGGLDAIWVNEIGFFLDDKCSVRIGRLPEVPERLGYNFLGYFSSNNDDAVQLIDAFGEYAEAMVPSYFDADVTIYAHWESESLAYFDPVGGYWYVENGRMPQTRVTDEELIADLEASRVTGANYEFAGLRIGSTKVGGVEYCKVYNNWYRVEPIRWRLVYSAEQQDGYIFNAGNDPGSTTLAIMAEIVYVDAYSTTKIGVGEGYSASSIEALKYNQISESYLKNESREVEVFGSPSSTVQSEADTIFVASIDELQQFTSSQFNPNGGETVGKVGFSDLVRDYLALFGQAERYFVRDIGNQLNNITTYTPAGGLSQARATIRLGIQYSIKVRQYECKEM